MGSPRLKVTPCPPTPLGGGDGGGRRVDVAQSPPAPLRLLRPLLQKKKIKRQRQKQREREREREKKELFFH